MISRSKIQVDVQGFNGSCTTLCCTLTYGGGMLIQGGGIPALCGTSTQGVALCCTLTYGGGM
jgi:hypothetical protein